MFSITQPVRNIAAASIGSELAFRLGPSASIRLELAFRLGPSASIRLELAFRLGPSGAGCVGLHLHTQRGSRDEYRQEPGQKKGFSQAPRSSLGGRKCDKYGNGRDDFALLSGQSETKSNEVWLQQTTINRSKRQSSAADEIRASKRSDNS
jgi:hypothetical protein